MTHQQYEPMGERIAPALYGDVVKCRHRTTGEIVAVKRMELGFAAKRRTKAANRVVEEDVHSEIATNIKISNLGGHAHVLPMREVIVGDDEIKLVMAYCAQGELLQVLNERRSELGTRDLLRYFKQIVEGVHFMHANGMAHRDLSLENVLVNAADDCQICDFGLTTPADSPVRATAIGKVHYMAPEACQVLGEFYNPCKADVWALGVMLFAMVAARYPFREPLRRDDGYRLLEDFGLEYLLERNDVEIRNQPDIVDLLRQLLNVDAGKRPSLAAVLAHPALEETPELYMDLVTPESSPTSASCMPMVFEEERCSPRSSFKKSSSMRVVLTKPSRSNSLEEKAIGDGDATIGSCSRPPSPTSRLSQLTRKVMRKIML